jgi:hypothetical protein
VHTSCGDQHSPDDVIGEQAALVVVLDSVPADLKAHKELQSVCAEHGQGDQYLD